MGGVRSDGMPSLAEARLVRRLQAGEPGAFQELWGGWRDRCWSVISPMAEDRDQAVALLRDVYLGLPIAVRGWPLDTPLCCLVGCHVFLGVHRGLELPAIAGIEADIPPVLAAPDKAGVAGRIAAMPPHVRLVYLVDLFFGCPAATTAALVGQDEHQLRLARSKAAWSVVAGGEG